MGFLTLIMKKTRLSDISIDVDKDWQTKGITNIKQVAASMSKGDLLVRDTNILVRLPPSGAGLVLTSTGLLKIPTWAPAGGVLKYYFPVIISSTDAESIMAVAHSIAKNGALATSHVQVYVDTPGSLVKRQDATLASVDAENVIVSADQSIAKNERVKAAMAILVDGFVEETAAAVQTDHTLEARSAAANDLNLCPMSDTVLDKIYIGSNYKFWQAHIQVGTNGAGNWSNAAYYWNGAWVAVVGEVDGSSSFHQGTGLKFITHTPQADWALSVIQGMNLYWMMIRTDNFINRVTKPLGSQIWVAANV